MGSIGTQKTISLWIDNQEVSSTIKFPVVNAETREVVHEAWGATPELAVQAVDSAEKAFWTWRETDPWHRRQLLLAAADYLVSKREEVAELIKVSLEKATDVAGKASFHSP